MMNPAAFVRDYIARWEDGGSTNPAVTHSLDPNDAGNWSSGKKRVGVLVGSNHGVTAAALAAHRHIGVQAITPAVMRLLTLVEAADIAIDAYYRANGLVKLPWDAVVASVLDFGWGAGPVRTVQKLQALVGVEDDGQIGNVTVAAYKRWRGNRTLKQAARTWADVRLSYYEAVIAGRPSDAKYRRGWRNRTLYFLPGDTERWWERFHAV